MATGPSTASLWGPGVTNRREALQHAHALVLDELGQDDRRVLDLGCGVGTAALYVARQRPVDVVGVSISPEQIRLAKRFADRGGPLRGNARFEVGDFTALPEDFTGFDLAFAIESFVHADPASAFFREVAGALQPDGTPRRHRRLPDRQVGPMAGSTTSGADGTPRAW